MKSASYIRSFAFFTLCIPCIASTLPHHHEVSSRVGHGGEVGLPSVKKSVANASQAFWAGATVSTLMREEAIPGRVFYSFDGVTVADPFKMMGDAGLNAIRIETWRGQSYGPTNFTNQDDLPKILGDELAFTLGSGGIDIGVKTVQRCIAQGMKVVHTINQNYTIPRALESLNYTEMIAEIQKETKRQLQPFLDAGIVPDVILLENEGSYGFLLKEESTGRTRGCGDADCGSAAKIDAELCGQIPTGSMASYAQVAGYWKAEIIAANEAIATAGLPTNKVRYGLHSMGQYVQWGEAQVHGPNPKNETKLVDSKGQPCARPVEDIIPNDILKRNASLMLNIAGFSAYPDPLQPNDPDSDDDLHRMLERPRTTLTEIQSYAEAYGRFEDGPFKGQYKLQALGVEWGAHFDQKTEAAQHVHFTEMLWEMTSQFESLLGVLFYEPWYCYANFEGGQIGWSYRQEKGAWGKGETGVVPNEVLTAWGKRARSPWKA